MTAPSTATHPCPTDPAHTVVPLSDGTMLCVGCRLEWDPANPPPSTSPSASVPAPPAQPVDETPAAHVTHVDVIVQWLDKLGVETRRHTHMTAAPHTAADAEAAAVAAVEDTLLVTGDTEGWRLIAQAVDWTSRPFGPPADPLADLIGREVILIGGRHGIVRAFPDDDHVTVELPNGRKTTVDFDDLTDEVRYDDAAGPVEIDLDDEGARALAGTYYELAALTIEAGVAMVDGSGADATVGVAPGGWLPFDGDDIALIEQGAASAVAVLVRTFDLPRATIDDVLMTLRSHAREGNTTMEGDE